MSKILIILSFCLFFYSFSMITDTDMMSVMEKICEGNWAQPSRFRYIANITQYYKTYYPKTSFHVKRKYCQARFGEDIEFPEQITSFQTMRIVWLKETSKSSNISYGYEIKNRIDGQKVMTKKIGKLNNWQEQILFSDNLLDTSTPSLQLELEIKGKSLNISINESYVIFCAKNVNKKNMTYSMRDCSPQEKNDYLTCECVAEEQEYVAYIIAIFWLFFSMFVVIPLLINTFNARKEHHLYVFSACNYKNYLFHYKITLRLGKVTKYFNLRNSVVDIQFYNSDKESLGPEIRFRASLLKNRSLNDIAIHMFRLSKMPDIDKISCGHSGSEKDGIYLFGLSVGTIKHYGTDEPIDRQYIVQKYILREKRLLNTTNKSHLNEEQWSEMIRIPHKLITRIELTYYQIIWILFVTFTVFGFISLSFQINLDAYDWSRFLISLLGTLGIGVTAGAVLIFVAKLLKLKAQMQTVLMNSTNKYSCLKFIFYVITGLVSLLLQKNMVDNGKTIDSIKALYWLSASFFSSSVFSSLWILSHEMQKMSTPEEEESFKEQSRSESDASHPDSIDKSSSDDSDTDISN